MSAGILARHRPWLTGAGTIVALLAVWQLCVVGGLVDRQMIPPATTVFGRFFAQFADAGFYADLGVTLLRVFGGFVLAVLFAVPAGLAMGYWKTCHSMFGLTIEVLRPIPATALVPVAAMIFGLGTEMDIAVIFIATAIPILVATLDGMRDIDPVLISTARTFGKKTSEVFTTVLLPATLPYLAAGLRLALTIALLVAIGTEMLIGSEGLGRRVSYATRMLDISGIYAGVLTLSVLGFLVNWLFVKLEDKLLSWHRRSRRRG
jgi:NitT/TauT family transport system permease protein